LALAASAGMADIGAAAGVSAAVGGAAKLPADCACMGVPRALVFFKILKPTFRARGAVCFWEEGGLIFCPRQ